jgi:hypothetical protein
VKKNVAPFSLPPLLSLLTAQIRPPCDSMIFFEINRPSPVPEKDFVANFENSF